MQIYNYDAETGQYIGVSSADADPLQPGNWLIPANATTIEPLAPSDGKTVNFENGVWVYKDIPPPPQPAPPEPYVPDVAAIHRTMYQNEADPLFFQWQRGEGTEQAWLDKVAEIKAREVN